MSSRRAAPKNNNTAARPGSSALSVTRTQRPALRAFSRNAAAAARNRMLAANIKRLKEEQKGLRHFIAKNAAALARTKMMARQLNKTKKTLASLSPRGKLIHNYFEPNFARLGIPPTAAKEKSPESSSPNRGCKGWFCSRRRRRNNK